MALRGFVGSADDADLQSAWSLLLVVGFFVAGPRRAAAARSRSACTSVLPSSCWSVGFAFFAFGWIGGGDAKLAAATTLWLGFGLMLPYLIYAALLGGALTLIMLALRRWPLPACTRAGSSGSTGCTTARPGVPYGIALAAAGLLVYSDTAIFQQLVA